MKVWKRILIKTVILAAVIAAGGGAAASYQAYRQSSAEYAVNHYLTTARRKHTHVWISQRPK